MLYNCCLINCIKATRVINAQAAGITNVNSSVIDMAGYEGVQFTALFGTITTTAVTGIKVQQGNQSDGSDMTDLAGTALAIPDTASNKVLISEIYKPTKRYVRLVVTRGTANAVIDGVLAQQFGARVNPPTNDSSVAATEYWVSPAEGIA
jgi:hypothetical protein